MTYTYAYPQYKNNWNKIRFNSKQTAKQIVHKYLDSTVDKSLTKRWGYHYMSNSAYNVLPLQLKVILNEEVKSNSEWRLNCRRENLH